VYGSRARIGLIVPSSNTVCEQEVAALCPEGVAAYAARVLFEPTMDGLRVMKNHVKRIAVATPYTSEINRNEKESLELRGYPVTDIRGYHETLPSQELKNDMIGRLQPDVAYGMGLKVNGKDNQVIFISCTNFRAIEIIESLERKTGKPVISSNQATLWYALRKLGIKDSIEGYGRLLRSF
jgi:maleate isomerase